jgi:Domain of unknown function (DUF4262)
MDHGDQKVLDDVATHGWHVVRVFEDDAGPGFAYTIGLFKNYGHPEVIAFGLPLDRLHALLNLVGDEAKAGHRRSPGDVSADLVEGYNCAFVEFPASAFRDYLGYALWFYSGKPFPALQLVWPDKDHRFPWDAGVVPEVRDLQPTPGKSVES